MFEIARWIVFICAVPVLVFGSWLLLFYALPLLRKYAEEEKLEQQALRAKKRKEADDNRKNSDNGSDEEID